uniref:Ubiquitinyl hydrolase 1 n=1 Tax=Romanomermis culicivorax TaxID=13658 RepID=A0A915I0J9_ROMCU
MYASTPSPQVSPVSATVGDDEIPSLGDDEDDQREKVSVTECGGDNDNDDVRESIVEYVPQLKHWTDGELRPVTTPTAKTDDNSQETPEEENVDFFSEISFDLIQPKPENENDQRIFNISCDGRMTMQQLKDKVASFINATPDQFKFIKMYTTMSEYPWNTPDELVRAISSCEGIKVKLGRVLKEDECLVKFYLFDAENFQPNKFLFDMVLDKNVTLSKTKSKVIRQLKRKCDIETEVSRIRFRELCQNKVDFIKSSCPMQERSTIMCNSLELHVQILKEPDPPNDQFILLFIRRWHPSTASYGTLKEIRLPVDCSYRTLFKMISSSSGINFENIEISCLNETGGFPFEYPKLKLLEETRFHKIPSDDTFFVSHTPLCLYHSGNLLYYRDSTEKSKMISDEERKQMQIQDSVRLRKASSFTFRKERALKIYTEISSSVKEDEENYDL